MSIKSMEVDQLQKLIEEGQDFLLVDCREQGEWDSGHIPQAKLLPMSEIESRYEELDKNKQIIVQCRSGKRSMNVCCFLEEKGYQDLTNLEGGILAWQEEGLDVTTD